MLKYNPKPAADHIHFQKRNEVNYILKRAFLLIAFSAGTHYGFSEKNINTTCEDQNVEMKLKSGNKESLRVVAIVSSNVFCNGEKSGSAIAYPSKGTGPYTYMWSNGATTELISGLSVGLYEVTVSDAAKNSATSFVEIQVS